MSDEPDPATLAARHGLSERGGRATRPALSYFPAFFKAKNDPWEAGGNEGGYVNLAVAQNFLTVRPAPAAATAADAEGVALAARRIVCACLCIRRQSSPYQPALSECTVSVTGL